MAERTAASITIGGSLKRLEDIDKLARAIIDDGGGSEWGNPYTSLQDTIEVIESAIKEGEHLLLFNDRARWGEFEEVEKFARQQHLRYSRHNEAQGELEAQLAYFDGDSEVTSCATQQEVMLVPFRDVLAAYKAGSIGQFVANLLPAYDPDIPPLTLAGFHLQIEV